jgi:cell division protein FtsB
MKWKKAIYYILVLAMVIYIVFFDKSSLFQKYKMKQKVEKMCSENMRLQKENERLQAENESLQSDNKILEAKAREFGMQKKGENVIQFKIEEK